MSQAPGNRLKIRFANGVPVECDIGVLATGYGTGKGSRRFGADPFVRTLPSNAADAEKIILVGSSLTMVDTLLRLRRVNRNAQITIISRNARLPHSQLRHSPAPADFKEPATMTTRRLLNAVREQCRDAMDRGDSWQAVINGLRSRAQDLWAELTVAEQRRFLRLLKTHWDVHRHRIPADIHDSLALELASLRTERIAGEVKGVSGDGPFDVAFRLRGRREITVISAGYVFDCSGWRPETNAPLHRDLIDKGFARTDPHRLGFTVRSDGRAMNVLGNARIFAIGPLCTGSLFEITAAPEIAGQACRLAASINAEMKLTREVSNSVSRSAPGR